jgi:DNA repair photolyase
MSLIYEPKGRAREYAAWACNVYRGCDHGCTYCYAPAALRMSREQFATVQQRRDFLRNLEREAATVKTNGEPILLCFSTDPYCHLDVELKLTRATIKILHAAGHRVTVLTKGGTRAFRDLDLFAPRDAFATTLTWNDAARSLEWEPEASTPQDRVRAIFEFHAAGIPTWVSLEPVLDPEVALQAIRETHPFVDLYKIGRWNYDARANEIDWRKFAQDAVALCESLGKRYLLKRDLACYLPQLAAGTEVQS